MQVKELRRQKKKNGDTIVELEVGKLLVRLIDTYDSKKTLEEMIYIIACRRVATKLA